MSKMIIKDKISMLRKGYPTVSDKYNVAGGILQTGSADVPFGELVAYDSQVGYYKAATSVTGVADIAGVVLATNVKLSGVWPDENQAGLVKPAEAFNLMLDGYIAVELDDSVETETVAAVAAVAKITADTDVVEGKKYYTRESNSDGIGYLNDGTYKYTLVAEPAKANLNTYYEITNPGSDAITDVVTPGKQAALILATGKLTTIEAVSAGTVVAMPGWYFTGLKEGRLAELEIRR